MVEPSNGLSGMYREFRCLYSLDYIMGYVIISAAKRTPRPLDWQSTNPVVWHCDPVGCLAARTILLAARPIVTLGGKFRHLRKWQRCQDVMRR
jgi:hypothetical protein